MGYTGKRNKKNKKSQMEVLGLVVIVLLISVALIFFITVSLKAKPSTTKVTFENKLLSTAMINVILGTTTSAACGYGEMRTAIIDMFEENNFCVPNSTSYVEERISEIFSKTLDEWQKDYVFLIYEEGREYSPLINITKAEKPLNVEASIYTLPSKGRNIMIRLDIVTR